MASNIRIESNEGNYRTVAFRFVIEDDLYLFFKFVSPKSNCEIAIAYDVYMDSGEWYVNDGELDDCDWEIVNDILFTRLPMNQKFSQFMSIVDAAVREFNGKE